MTGKRRLYLELLAEAMPKSCLSDDQVFHYSERKDGIYQEVTIVVVLVASA